MLWFAWAGYAWLGDTAKSDEGLVGLALLSAMAAMLIASLAVPHAFGADGLIFGIAHFVVRSLHTSCYTAIARSRHDSTLAAAVAHLGSTILPAATLLVLAGALSDLPRALCWVATDLGDYGGIAVRGVEGWQIAPGHFAERVFSGVVPGASSLGARERDQRQRRRAPLALKYVGGAHHVREDDR